MFHAEPDAAERTAVYAGPQQVRRPQLLARAGGPGAAASDRRDAWHLLRRHLQ